MNHLLSNLQKKKAIDRLAGKGIKVHANFDSIVPYFSEMDKGNVSSAAKYKSIRGDVRVYYDALKEKLDISPEEVVPHIEHELFHKAIQEGTLTSKERKKINDARKVYKIYAVLDNIGNDIRELQKKVEVHTGTEEQISQLSNELKERKTHYWEYRNSPNNRIPKDMNRERVNDLLFKKLLGKNKVVEKISEPFAQILNAYNFGYDSEKDRDTNTNYTDILEDKKLTDIFAEEIFGPKIYNSSEQKEVYLSLTDFYRKLLKTEKPQTVMQIIMPFSNYVKDESEFRYILSSDAGFDEFYNLMKNTPDKRETAKNWFEKNAAEYMGRMFKDTGR